MQPFINNSRSSDFILFGESHKCPFSLVSFWDHSEVTGHSWVSEDPRAAGGGGAVANREESDFVFRRW